MKTLAVVCLFLCMATVSLAAEQSVTVYNGAVLTEDTTWRGSILVNGFVVVAPQATLRIEPGTVVRFVVSVTGQLPNLVVQGRLHAVGLPDRQVLFTADRADRFKPLHSLWGGIVMLSTEKRNLLEQCRIEYAETGIDLRFSTLTLKSVSITQARTALLSHDGIVHMSNSTVSDSDTGVEINTSEFDSKDMSISSCQRGCVLHKSAAVFTSPKIMNNQKGLESDDCRIKITGGEFSGNTLGVQVKGGEGQIVMSRILRNSQIGMHLVGTRIKVQRCLFSENRQSALRTEDGQALLLNNAFVSNGGFNLYNAGHDVVSARQNWWGTTDQSLIGQKIYDAARDKNSGAVNVFPWLITMPLLMP